jgi:uncharacterized protein YutE (UPF0331/DUF86 family)
MLISGTSSWRLWVQNADRISKGLADVLEAKSGMQNILLVGKEAFFADKKNSLALKYLLIEAVEAITDVCQHLLAKSKGVACSGYIDCIVKAGELGIIKPDLSNKLRKLADLRNSLIHRYWIIKDETLYLQSTENINDFSDFADQVNTFLSVYKK